MDLPQPETPQPAKVRSKRRTAWVIALVFFVLFLVLGICLVLVPGDSNLTWLTPQQVANSGKPGVFQGLRTRLRSWAGPVLQWYHHSKVNILVDTKVLTLTPTAEAAAALGAPTATNAAGLRAWILQPGDPIALQTRLTNGGAYVKASPRTQTLDGQHATMQIGNNVPLTPGQFTMVGLAVDVIPEASREFVKLTISAAMTEPEGSASTGISIKTNFYAACRATVPGGGALVIQCANSDPAAGSNYWLVITPTILDPLGNPLAPTPSAIRR